MKTAVISDVHGNLEAFQQVMADIDAMGVQRIICLGDCIGYGPQPEEVIQIIRAHQIPTLLGNHELAACDPAYMNWFNPKAKRSLEIILAMLSPASMEFIHGLPTSLVIDDCRFVHGFPPDSVRTYLFQKSELELLATFNQMAEPICFIGHTHNLEVLEYTGRQVERRSLASPVRLNTSHRYIINVGSVGQPRDGTHPAKYVLWHPAQKRIEVRAVEYNIAAVASKIEAAGLPPENAKRLWC